MKKLFAIIAAIALTAGTALAGNGVRIINMDLVLKSFSKTPAAEETLKTDAMLLESQEKEMQEELQKDQKEIQEFAKSADDPTKSEKVKASIRKQTEEKMRALLAKRDEFVKSLQLSKNELAKKQQELMRALLAEIAPVVEKYAKDNDLDAVLDITSRTVIYYRDELDITPAISAELEKLYPHENAVPTTTVNPAADAILKK